MITVLGAWFWKSRSFLTRVQAARSVCCDSHAILRHFFSTTRELEVYLRASPSPEVLVAEMDPYSYTSGRWVHQDTLQRAARYIYFNFPALCEKSVIACPGAKAVIDCQKVEGGFNRSFILTMDNEMKVVARLPISVAGPSRLTARSEVATMSFVSDRTSIPVPKVLDWNDDPQNAVGSEYIIMEFVHGARLSERWETIDAVERMKCTQSLSMFMKEMSEAEFQTYGCLTFSTNFVESRPLTRQDASCSLGPHCGAKYWKCGVGEVQLFGGETSDHGPWKDLSSFVSGLAKTGLVRVPHRDPLDQPEFRGNIDDHTRMLDASEAVMQELIKDPRIQAAAFPILFHPDLNKRNIFVSELDPSEITGIIDWQGASIEPAFMFASDTPDFAALPDHLLLAHTDASDKAQDQKELEIASICAKTFDTIMKGYAPKLEAARRLDDSVTRLFRYCIPSWSALLSQEKLYQDLEDAMKLKAGVMQILGANPDGHVPNELWERAEALLLQIRDQWIESALESGTPKDEAKKMFPFDGM